MPSAARRNLERLGFLCRALAVLVGAVVGGQVYARSAGAMAAVAAGGAAWVVLQLLLGLVMRRQHQMLDEVELDDALPPRPRPRRKPRPTRRLLSDDEK